MTASATVAVIEDQARIAEAVAARLRAEGFRVELATSGPDGVELCRRLRPDLVILDWMRASRIAPWIERMVGGRSTPTTSPA
jgi:DNA-binding response OmpR family regulator